jgi:predicted dehydrogenase
MNGLHAVDPRHRPEPARLGLIGFGKLGSLHARNIVDGADTVLVGVHDANPESLARARAAHDVPVTGDLDAFLAIPMDGVVIASSTQAHAEHIVAVARAGLGIFVEKPVGLTLEETDEVLQEVVDAGLPFQIGFQRRWDPRFRQAKALIAAGEIGTPVLLKAHGRDPDASNPANWGLHRNGGLFLNCAIHDFDVARFLFDREVSAVSASGGTLVHAGLREAGDLDTCSTTLFFGEDAMSITEWSRYASHGYDVAMEIIGTEGMLHFGSDRGGSITVQRSRRGVPGTPGVFEIFGEAYRDSVAAFATSLLDGVPTEPGVEDARAALHLALCARRSQREGRSLAVPFLPPLTRSVTADVAAADLPA